MFSERNVCVRAAEEKGEQRKGIHKQNGSYLLLQDSLPRATQGIPSTLDRGSGMFVPRLPYSSCGVSPDRERTRG